jgi:hypothetical protein
MARTRPIAPCLGLLAVLLSVIAFALGSAPFTPAKLLVFPALPLAGFSTLLGAPRLAGLAAYWSTATLLSVPLADRWQHQ